MIITPRVPEVEFYLDRWRDVSADVRQGSKITLTTGRKDWGAKTSPARLMFTLDDGPEHGDGDYDPDNPLGQWYGILGRNTPVRYSLRYGVDVFTRANQAGAGSSPTMGAWSAFALLTGTTAITSNTLRHNVTSGFQASYLGDVQQRNVEVYDEFTLGALTVTGGDLEPANLMLRGHTGGDYWLLRVVVNTANQVSLRLMLTGASTVAGPVTAFTYPAGGTTVGVRFQAEGDTLRGKVWRLDQGEPLAWQLETTVANESLGTGWVGVRSGVGAGNTNAKPVVVTHSRFLVRIPQFIGETAKLEPESTVDHASLTTNVEAASIRRRLSQGERGLDTALRRYILRSEAPFGVADYWPLDEPLSSATRAQNLLGGVAAKYVRGPSTGLGAIKYGVDTELLATPTGAELTTDARLQMNVTAADFNATTGYAFTWLQRVGPGSTGWAIMDFTTCQIFIDFVGGVFTIRRSDKSTFVIVTLMTVNLDQVIVREGTDADWHMIGWGHRQVGADTIYEFAVDDYLVQTTMTNSGGLPNWLVVLADAEPNSTMGIAHVVAAQRSLFNSISGDFPYRHLRNLYLGRPDEHAGTRFARLCTEEGVPYALIGSAADTPAMGPQRPLTLLQLVDECIAVDQGSAFDPRGSMALGMRTHRATTAKDPVLTLDYIGQVAPEFKPTTDDQGTRNDITAKRPNGGEYRVEQATGAMNTADPGTNADAVGRYDSSVTVNVSTDEGLPDAAGWRVHMGTVDEPRFPTLTVDLFAEGIVADPATLSAALDVAVDDAITVTGMEARRIYNDVRLIARGATSTVDTAYQHKVQFNCEPYKPLDVAVFGEAEDRWGEGTSSLTAGITDSATSFSVTTTAGEVWTTDAGAFPMDINVGGERIQLSGISGTSSPQTFTVAPGGRAINGVVKPHTAGTAVRLFRPVYHGH